MKNQKSVRLVQQPSPGTISGPEVRDPKRSVPPTPEEARVADKMRLKYGKIVKVERMERNLAGRKGVK